MARRKRKPANRASRPVAQGGSTAPAAITAPPEILDLVDRFRRNRDAYRNPAYKEAPLRREFLDPFFEALGWDVQNRQGYAEAYKDVVHEDALKVGGATKAPDYGFRIGGQRKFFVEAKKPSVDLAAAVGPSYQLRRYAWSAKLPLSVLTDFEEFAVYDCRIRPKGADKPSAARILYLTFEDYPTRWTDIAEVFSKDAVLKGSFDRYAAKSRKRGTATVDQAFLAEIETWRDGLARNLALRNPGLSVRDLNFAVQRTIDRIIFLRMGEDRGAEPYGELLALVNGPKIYPRLLALFERADDKYNSGLFYFREEKGRPPPDELTPRLTIDDNALKTIIRDLYYPQSPYEFSVLGADILGQVYEQFLGKVIRLTPGHRAKVEEKPEVKKAGGVYYTPTYIVRYIVENTVGRLIGGKTPRQISRLRVLDPACGSGSFLIGAYESILNYHRDWYVEHDPPKHRKKIYQGAGGQWFLTIQEKKRILLNNIYGVDIDGQAVEVTKLSLLLKVLEGENQDSLERQMRLIRRERALPDLASNIKCGNSLIGTDFFQGRQMSLLDDEEELYRVNAFDWATQFPAILGPNVPKARRGFDAVIGNPPWGQKGIYASEREKHYIRGKCPSCLGIFDAFRPFVERGIGLICDSGKFGMVLPDIVLLKNYEQTRRHILEHLALEAIDWWGMAFASAVIDAATIIGSKCTPAKRHCVRVQVHDPEMPLRHELPQSDFWSNRRCVFNLFLTPEKRRLIDQLEDCPKFGDYFEAHEGVHSGNIRSDLFVDHAVDDTCRQLLFGRSEIAPYVLQWHGRYLRLAAAPVTKTRARYANIGKPEWYSREKLLVRRTGDHVLAAVDREGRYASNNFFVVLTKRPCSLSLDGLCALLNSRFMTWYFQTIEPRRGRVFAELKIKHLQTFPLPARVLQPHGCRELNELGAERAALAIKMTQSSNPQQRTTVHRACDYVDASIDTLVCKLLGVSDFSPEARTFKEEKHGKSKKREPKGP